MALPNRRLMRIAYLTDTNADDPEYVGAFSAPFPHPANNDSVIVGVDWSEQGRVWITYMIPEEG